MAAQEPELGLCPALGTLLGSGGTLRVSSTASSDLLQEYAGEGLRTLVLAYRDLEESYYKDWSERLHRAGSAPEAREDHLARLYDEVEHDMMVGGLEAEAGGGCGQPLLTSHPFGSPSCLEPRPSRTNCSRGSLKPLPS